MEAKFTTAPLFKAFLYPLQVVLGWLSHRHRLRRAGRRPVRRRAAILQAT